MKETLWVVLALFVMLLLGAARAVPFLELIALGQSVMLYGAGIGVPLEIVYFGALAVCLRLAGKTPAGWYWRSFEHHHLLTPQQRWLVLPFFFLGALSFLVATIGIAIVVTAIVSVSFSG